MTKRILSVLAMMSIAAMMMLSSCSDIGTETGTETGTNTDCSLIGKWENEKDGVKTTVEITADDKIIVTVKYEVAGEKKESKSEGTIKSVSGKEITYEVDGKEAKVEYSDLGNDTVKFGSGENKTEYKKV